MTGHPHLDLAATEPSLRVVRVGTRRNHDYQDRISVQRHSNARAGAAIFQSGKIHLPARRWGEDLGSA
jgi:hypothetical protein